MHSNTFAARAGRWSAKHRKKAIWGWLAFVAIAFVIGGALGVKKPANQNDYIGQSGKADRLIDNHFPKQEDETVLVQAAKGGRATDPAVRKAVDDVIAGVSREQGVAEVKSPYAKGNEGQVSKDGRSVLVEFKVRGNDDQTSKRIDPIVASVAKVKADNPKVFVGQFGGASANKALSKSFSDDFKKAEFLSLPITLIILILAFGALVAAGVPLLLGLTAVMATLGLVAIPSQFVPMDDTVSSVVLLVGLAVGVDYTLFYLRREREEKARGATKMEAVHTAAATSGRAVLVSGFTVMVAMAGMFFAGGRTFTALGVGAIMVVAVAMIGSVTVVPAVLAWLGDRIEKGRVPFLHGRRNSGGESRAWDWILTKVLKHPVVSAVASAGILIVLALPAFGMHTVLTGTDDLPRKLEVMKVYDREQAAFPGGQIPAVVAIEAKDVTTPQIQAAVKKMGDRAFATRTMNGPLTIDVSADKHVASIAIPMRGDGTDQASANALSALRGGIVDQTVGSAPGVKSAYVTGIAAGTKDFNDLVKAHAPIVFAFVLSLAFLLLLVTFRSIVIPHQGDRAEPAVGGRVLRDPDLDLPGRPFPGALGLQVQRGHRQLAAAVPVRDPLRAVDGLPRVHPHPGPRGVRPRHEDRGRRRLRDQGHGLDGDQRRHRDGRGLRDLRDAELAGLQDDGRGPVGGDPARRDAGPRRAAAGHDEAPGRLELVPAQGPELAAAHLPRACAGARSLEADPG